MTKYLLILLLAFLTGCSIDSSSDKKNSYSTATNEISNLINYKNKHEELLFGLNFLSTKDEYEKKVFQLKEKGLLDEVKKGDISGSYDFKYTFNIDNYNYPLQVRPNFWPDELDRGEKIERVLINGTFRNKEYLGSFTVVLEPDDKYPDEYYQKFLSKFSNSFPLIAGNDLNLSSYSGPSSTDAELDDKLSGGKPNTYISSNTSYTLRSVLKVKNTLYVFDIKSSYSSDYKYDKQDEDYSIKKVKSISGSYEFIYSIFPANYNFIDLNEYYTEEQKKTKKKIPKRDIIDDINSNQ